MNHSEMAYQEVIAFWFGRLPLRPDDLGERLKLWYGFDSATDALIQERFGTLVKAALAGSCQGWEAEALPRLALIIVLDQFTRNICRGRAGAFAGDERALALALNAIDQGMDREVGLLERAFYYMPLQHAEDLAAQELSVRVTKEMDAECLAAFENFSGEQASYARDHRDVIARFGRFPHRNKALARESTEEELAYLAGDAPTYGQSSAEDP